MLKRIIIVAFASLLLALMGSRRKQAIFLGLPDALDLMVVCVEAGLGLDQAMRKVSEEMKKAHRVIAEEFAICNFHLQMGKERVCMEELTWYEYAERIKTDVILLPIGSTEQHGPHLPLGTDAMQIMHFSKLAAEKIGGLVAPALSYGYKSQPESIEFEVTRTRSRN